MKAYGEMDAKINVFITSELIGSESLASCPCRFNRKKKALGTHWVGGWVGPKTGPGRYQGVKILAPTKTQTPTLQSPKT
jgi:hypothetical protein